MPGFSGFPKEGMTFFRQLKKNNNREWFQERKHIYDEKLRAPMEEMVHLLNGELAKAAPQLVTEPKKAIYRIYRDTRFSKDKTPYKTHVAAIFRNQAMEKHASAGLYFSVSPEEVEVAGGVYMPGPEEIKALRNFFADNHAELRRLIEPKSFRSLLGELQGTRLTRMPKGFAADHPAGDLLVRKQWYFYTILAPELAIGDKMWPEVRKRFLALVPVVNLMNRPLLAQRKKLAALAAY